MKSSASARKGRRFSKCLLVDGYNIIARMQRKPLTAIDDLPSARDDLADALGEYRVYSGEDVALVFDAHRTAEVGKAIRRAGIDVFYTAKHETADQRIESLVYELRDVYPEITVATSDLAEQQVTFGGGALRISADELIRRLREAKRAIRRKLMEESTAPGNRRLGDRIDTDVLNRLEKWRRRE